METGAVEVLFRVNGKTDPNSQLISKQEVLSIPEFVRETSFKDCKFGTLKRDTNLRMFDRAMVFMRAKNP
jgi:hypothetical protein